MDPAAAVAAGICLVAQVLGAQTPRHPRRCGWCEYPPDELSRMLTAFAGWAGREERTGTYGRHEARVFAELPRSRQLELVTAAQAFDELPA